MTFKFKSPFARVDWSGLSRIFHHFGKHLKPHKKSLVLGGLSLLGLAFVELARPWPLKIVFDYILIPSRAHKDWSFLAPLSQWDPMAVLTLAAGGVILLALLGALFSYAQNVLFASVGQKLSGAIRLELFSHIQRLPQSYHDYRQTGELLMRLTGDINLLKELLTSIFITLGSRIFIVLGMLGLMVYMNWKLTLLALAVMPFLFLTTLRFSGKIKEASRRARKKEGQLSAAAYEGVSGISVTKVFGREKWHEKLLGKSVSSDVKAGLKATKLEAAYSRWVDVLTALGTVLVLFFGVKQVLAGQLTAGNLLIFLSYLRTSYKPLRDVAQLSARTAKATVCGERIIEILHIQPEVIDRPEGISARDIKGEIRFDKVRFAYQPGQPALEEVSFTLPAGKTTAIIGPSGAGKSTVAKLILRLYEPASGGLYVDGLPIGEYRIQSLRKRITSLSQEAFLFRTSILENIAFGNPKASFEEIAAAARKVGADEFIRNPPEGYNTLVGEGGQTLSGGQRQRITFARAALRDSRIMIFDEPATGLDPQAEKVAQEALSALKEGRTLLLITHRLNFLNLADRVVYLEAGRMAEQGTVEELLVKKGKFFAFYQEWLGQNEKRNLFESAAVAGE
ncbi:MAG TPA: ABC transporter ATP-binding protein [candidate division Zixibacteria bacterium]|nr:ABC transporter ATP-binding protein [candidate division Zixibacteria bacterium]